jgi:hypothetical protein
MDTVMSVARHGGQLIAGYLLSKGIIDASMSETVTGIVVSLATLGWFFYSKRQAK